MTGLEAIEEFKGNNNTKLVGRAMGKQHYLDCLQVMEKSLKALEIIKEKCVDIYILKDLGILDEYNKWVLQRYGTYYQLTEEEFDLLKEVLE